MLIIMLIEMNSLDSKMILLNSRNQFNDRFDRLERSIWALRRGNFKPNKSKNSKKRSENNGGEDGEKEKDEGK